MLFELGAKAKKASYEIAKLSQTEKTMLLNL